MKTDKCRPVDDELRLAVACLELDISDSSLEDILTALTERKKDVTNTHAADLLLQCMESIARHIDSLRVKSNPRAFGLIDELWDSYAEITLNLTDDESFKLALAKNQEVLDWLQQCLAQTLEKPATVSALPSPAVTQLVQEQIAKTNNFVRHEIDALKFLAGFTSYDTPQPERLSTEMNEQIHDLQELFMQEINKLRLEIHPKSDNSSGK